MKLIIVESPAKIKSYKKALGSGYEVLASFGHCVDLPPKKLSIDIKKKFEPTFEVIADKKPVIKNIKFHAKKATDIYLMQDPDREGEAIAWHIQNEIKGCTKGKIHRASTNEITASAIKKALQNTSDVNQEMINAYLTRRLLDRLCGYKTSYLTQQATGGRSAGRVQSAVLRILAEREKEIQNFVPEEYWVLTAHFLSSKWDDASGFCGGLPYIGVLDGKIKVPNEKKATQIYNDVIKGSPVITSVEQKVVNANPYAPFVTSSLIQSSSSIFGWSSKKTMKTAQFLYEQGHITYMRTDSPRIAPEAIEAIRALISHDHGPKYLPATARLYGAKKGAQEGHECCRPTSVDVGVQQLHGDEQKLYEMIWRRTISCQMTLGQDKQTKAITKTGGYDFISNGKIRIFDGFRKVWNYSKSADTLMPDLYKGEKCSLDKLEKEQKFTVPPSRYTDGSITKQCEKLQIGRPSTYQQCIETLVNRKYVSREKKALHATKLGIDVTEFLVGAHFCFVDLKFTAEMEQSLDEISKGSKDKLDVLQEFWTRLKQDIESGKELKTKNQFTEFKCPKCKGTLLKKHSRWGAFFSCENYKKDDGCPYIATVGEHGEPIEKKQKEKEYASFNCQECNSKMVKRVSKYGEFYGCENFSSGCKFTTDMSGTPSPKKKGYKKYKKKKKKSKSV